METPFLQELERSLRLDDPDLLFEVTPSGAAHIRTRLDADQEPAVLFATEEHLAAAVTAVGEGCRDELWPDSTITAAGFNLLLVHLDEIAATRDTTQPIVMTRQGWQWPEPAEETWRPPGDYEPGDLVWVADPNADIAAAAQERDTQQRLFLLRAWLGPELAFEVGHIPAETLAVAQDQAASELGSRAEARLAAQTHLTASDLRTALTDRAHGEALLRVLQH